MATKKHNIIVIAASAVIAIFIAFIQWRDHQPKSVESNIYKVGSGWGYDILIGKQVMIHQASIPALPAKRVFTTKEQAEKAAALVIRKLKNGQPPTLTKFDLEKILPVHELENDQ